MKADLNDLHDKASACFEVDLLRCEGLRLAVALHGRETVFQVYRLGWVSGAQQGLQLVREAMQA